MKRLAIALLLTLIAVSATAATLTELNAEVYAEGEIFDVAGMTVMAVRSYGAYVTDGDNAVNTCAYLYTGSGHGMVVGDIVDVTGGTYDDYYGLTELKTSGVVDAVMTIVSSGNPVPAPHVLTAAVAYGAAAESYECCLVTIDEALTVATAPDSYGQWTATAGDATVVHFDDYFYDDSTVVAGDCYSSVTGVFDYHHDLYRVQPLEFGITFCPVPNDEASFGTLKAMYK